jgi:ribosomal protein S18 acetylase RimI-like enzyme
MFAPDEMAGFDEMLAGYLDGTLPDHHWVVAESGNAVVGGGYHAPEPFGDRVWNLYFLAVHPEAHGRGVGGRIVTHVVERLRAAGEGVARVLLVETSSTPQYDGARAFYLAHGFVEEARIREFYGPGDDKIVFWRAVSGDPGDPGGARDAVSDRAPRASA